LEEILTDILQFF